MMQYDGGTASMLAPVPWCLQLNYSPLCTYRDSIRRVSVPGVVCRPALRFLPTTCDAAAGEGAYYYPSPAASDASAASCSSVSSSFSDDSGLRFSGWGAANPDDGVEELTDIALRMVRDGYMQGLIRAFGAGRSSSAVHYAGPGPSPEELLLGGWFSELDVDWVLHAGDRDWAQLHLDLEDGCASLLDLMERWIKALKVMVQALCGIKQLEVHAKTTPAVAVVRKAIRYFKLLATGKAAGHEQEVARFVRFAEASILRMLDFVDAVAVVAVNDDSNAAETLPGMLQVYTCVVDDSPTILALFKEAASSGDTSMFESMNSAFLWRRNKLGDAIWSMVEKVRASFVADDCWGVSPEEAGGVHKTTRLMMNYITLLSRNEGALNLVLQDRQHGFRMFLSEPDSYSSSSSAASLIRKMIGCLEKQLEKASTFITNPGLRYLFLMNNCSFISQKASSLLLPSWALFQDYNIERSKKRESREKLPPMDDYIKRPDPNLQEKIEMESNLDGLTTIQSFIEAYLDASWEPVMSCLYHDIPRGFLRFGGTLDKFESEFQRTYTMQRPWKVPNPELRKRLRKAVIEKLIPGYSKYMAERTLTGKSNRSSNRTPAELEELLEELFEG